MIIFNPFAVEFMCTRVLFELHKTVSMIVQQKSNIKKHENAESYGPLHSLDGLIVVWYIPPKHTESRYKAVW